MDKRGSALELSVPSRTRATIVDGCHGVSEVFGGKDHAIFIKAARFASQRIISDDTDEKRASIPVATEDTQDKEEVLEEVLKEGSDNDDCSLQSLCALQVAKEVCRKHSEPKENYVLTLNAY